MNVSKKKYCFVVSHVSTKQIKCLVCNEKDSELFCTDCEKAYCGEICGGKDFQDHMRICAGLWCNVVAEEKKLGRFHDPCEGRMRKYICYGCCEIKSLKTKICSQCKTARYCSPECQNKDWGAFHKRLCRTYQTTKQRKNLEKKFKKNGMVMKATSDVCWCVLKNGNPLPGNYRTKKEAQTVYDQLEKHKDSFYAVGNYFQKLYYLF